MLAYYKAADVDDEIIQMMRTCACKPRWNLPSSLCTCLDRCTLGTNFLYRGTDNAIYFFYRYTITVEGEVATKHRYLCETHKKMQKFFAGVESDAEPKMQDATNNEEAKVESNKE